MFVCVGRGMNSHALRSFVLLEYALLDMLRFRFYSRRFIFSFFAYALHRFSILFELTWNQCLNQHFVKSKRSIFRTSKNSGAQMHTVTYKGVTNNFEYYIVDSKTPFIYFLCIFWFEKKRANTTEQTCKHCAKDCKSSNLSRRTTLFHAQYVWLKQDIIKTISEISRSVTDNSLGGKPTWINQTARQRASRFSI